MKTSVLKLLSVSLFLLTFNTGYAQPIANHTSHSKINITSFNIYEKAGKLCFDWATDGTVTTNIFEVQQSTDGINYNTVALVLGPDPRQQGDNYACTFSPKGLQKNGKNYFRLKHIDNEGVEQFGETKEAITMTATESCK